MSVARRICNILAEDEADGIGHKRKTELHVVIL